MNFFRLTKYDPNLRDQAGTFHGREWTSSGDICSLGAQRIGTVSLPGYLEVESNHLVVVASALVESNVASMSIQGLERDENDEPRDVFEGASLTQLEAVDLLRKILRERLWCRIEAPDFYIHVGYDYYVYIGSHSLLRETHRTAERLNLFLESSVPSPYLRGRPSSP